MVLSKQFLDLLVELGSEVLYVALLAAYFDLGGLADRDHLCLFHNEFPAAHALLDQIVFVDGVDLAKHLNAFPVIVVFYETQGVRGLPSGLSLLCELHDD